MTPGNLGLVLAFAICVLSVLRLRSRPAYLVGLYLNAFSAIVLVLEVAGLLDTVTRPVVLALQLLFIGAAAVIWLRHGRHALLSPFADFRLSLPNAEAVPDRLSDERRVGDVVDSCLVEVRPPERFPSMDRRSSHHGGRVRADDPPWLLQGAQSSARPHAGKGGAGTIQSLGHELP